jgi:hypothetical protein
MFRLVTDEDSAQAVPATGLTLLHVLTGQFYGVGFRPVFIVHSDHEGYEQLIEGLRDERG